MNLSEEVKARLGVALNEADLLEVELAEEKGEVAVTFAVLSLPLEGPAADDRRVRIVFRPVGRIAASWRQGDWDDAAAEVTQFEPEELPDVVKGFGGQPIYGWDFFSEHAQQFSTWSERLSMDWRRGPDGMRHTIRLFQEGIDEHLDLCIWFDAFQIEGPPGNPLTIEEFCDGGSRWWTAMRSGDPAAGGEGIAAMEEGD